MVNFHVSKPIVMSKMNLGTSFRNSAFMQIRTKPTKNSIWKENQSSSARRVKLSTNSLAESLCSLEQLLHIMVLGAQ